MQDSSDLEPRPRLANRALAMERGAKSLVRDASSAMGKWQSEAAYLTGLLQREKNRKARETAVMRCQVLLDEIRTRHMLLLKQLNGVPEAIRGHSRVDDLLRALSSLEQTIHSLVTQAQSQHIERD